MLKRFLKNYGLMMAGAFGILCGMLVYQQYKQDVLDYSLDMVGNKLVGMAETEDKSTILALYEGFKDRALANEVPAGEIEHVAANILNLHTEGLPVTTEQVKAMLDEPKMVLTSFGIPPVPSIDPVTPDRRKALGENLKSLCEFDDQFQQTLQQLPKQDREHRRKVHYDGKNGLRVLVDVDLKRSFPGNEFGQIDKDLRRLRKDTVVVWSENLQDSLKVVRARIREQMAVLADSSWNPAVSVTENLKHLKSLDQLANFDYHVDEARLKAMIASRVKKSLEEKLKKMDVPQRKSDNW